MKKVFGLILVFAVLISGIVFGDTVDKNEVEVNIPKFDVRINGKGIDSTTEKYPLIVYKGITYIPMTWNMSNALGLKYTWRSDTGIAITRSDEAEYLEMPGGYENSIYKTYTASVADYGVSINGKIINNDEEQYPLLSFRYITYFPMTYNFMVNEFNTKYKYSDEKGLSVDVDPKLTMNYPEPVIIKEEVIVEDLIEYGGFAGEYFTMENNSHEMITMKVNYFDTSLYGKLMNVSVNFFNKKDEYMFTKYFKTGAIYEKPSDYSTGFGRKIFDGNSAETYGRMEVTFEFINHEVAMNIAYTEALKQGVQFEFLTSEQVTKDKMIEDGASYIYPQVERSSEYEVVPSDELMTYAALFTEGEMYFNTDEMVVNHVLYDHTYKIYKDVKEELWNLNFYTEFKYNADVEEYKQFEGYSNGNLFKSTFGNFIRLYDNDKKLVKVYVVTDKIAEQYN